ncbi:hypothetical protein [Chitinophaga sp. HK235]|uniref:hypothetical protein n=1 Tax=Chitinophaga sp. HK235 TaxID=2952571 RepID=UPI001BA6B681|nr:hypothetical protein [Chitinophaga sp. HK235]
MSNLNVFIVMLESSKTEQLPVHIFLTHHTLSGIVTHIDADYVEIRTEEGKRGLISLEKIEAITGH